MRLRKTGLVLFVFLIIVPLIFANAQVVLPIRERNDEINDLPLNDAADLPRLSGFSPNGTAVCTEDGFQDWPELCSDGLGGAIIVWTDHRGVDVDIYAQRVDAYGAMLWEANGTAICTAAGNQQGHQVCPDGAGGAIITWQDARSGVWDIYAQRIDATGAVKWTVNGIAICTEAGNQNTPQLCSDGAGGAIITWTDNRSAYDIYAQRVNATGAVQWAANGVAICTAAYGQTQQQICSDGAGGAIITWADPRSYLNIDIYAQRVVAAGAVQWTANGVAICTAGNPQMYPELCSDGAGGAIITWVDLRSGFNPDTYAQRVSAAGAVQWTVNGVAICTGTMTTGFRKICSDGAGGAFIAWTDQRSGGNDVYAQRVAATGAVQWTANGVAICTEAGIQGAEGICSDGAGGVIIVWQDTRNTNGDVYAQRVSATGVMQWAANGTAICTDAGLQYGPEICSTGIGGAYIAWADQRSGNYHIYCYANDYLAISLDSISVGTPSNAFDELQLYFKNDANYHKINSSYNIAQQTVSIQYHYQFRGLLSSFPYYIENLTINLAYNETKVEHRTLLDIYNYTSATWINVADKGTSEKPLMGAQAFEFISKTGLYHLFNDTEMLVRVQVLDLQDSGGFAFWLDRLMVQYDTDIHLEVMAHLENGLQSPPGAPQLSESEDFNVSITAKSWVGSSYTTWTNISISHRVNDGMWNTTQIGSFYGVGTAYCVISENKYVKGDDLFYYFHLRQFNPTINLLQDYYWTQDGFKSDESSAQAVAFQKPVYPNLYHLSLNYSVFYKAQLERVIVPETGANETCYPWINLEYENFSLNFYNTTPSLTNFSVYCTDEDGLNHYVAEDTRNISKYNGPLFNLSDNLKSPFVLQISESYPLNSTIIVPMIAYDRVDSPRHLIFTGAWVNLTYKGIEPWPYPHRTVLKFTTVAEDIVLRFDGYTGIMVYYHYVNNTVLNANQQIVIGLTYNNKSYPINLWIEKRYETSYSGFAFLNDTIIEILHDPPGDQSFSMLQSGTSIKKGISVESSEAKGIFTETQFMYGGWGGGVDASCTWSDSTEYDTEWEWTWTTTLTSSLNTENPELIGPGRGDLYYLVGLIIQYWIKVANYYIVLGGDSETLGNYADPADGHRNDLLVWTNGSRIEYGLTANASKTVYGSQLADYNATNLASNNIFADNKISPAESASVKEIQSLFWTPGGIVEFSYVHSSSKTKTISTIFECSSDAFFAWDQGSTVIAGVGVSYVEELWSSQGKIGIFFDYSETTISTSSTEQNEEIMIHLEDDDSTPIGQQDQFLVQIYEDLVYNTFGVTFDENFTYTSRPYEIGTKDRRSPTVSEIFGVGEYVCNIVNISCAAIDEETGVNIVEFYWDDDPIYDRDELLLNQIGFQTNPSSVDPNLYQIAWDTSGKQGTYYLFAVTYDSASGLRNIKVSAPYLIHIDNIAPTICQTLIYGPFRQAIDFYANTFDADSGIAYVEYWDGNPDDLGSNLLGISSDSSSAYHFIWATNSNGANDGSHSIYTRAYDRAGNYRTSPPVSIQVDNSELNELPSPDYTLPIIIGALIIGATIAIAIFSHALLLRGRTAPTPMSNVKKKISSSALTPSESSSSEHSDTKSSLRKSP